MRGMRFSVILVLLSAATFLVIAMAWHAVPEQRFQLGQNVYHSCGKAQVLDARVELLGLDLVWRYRLKFVGRNGTVLLMDEYDHLSRPEAMRDAPWPELVAETQQAGNQTSRRN